MLLQKISVYPNIYFDPSVYRHLQLVSFPVILLGGIITNILELAIDYGYRIVEWFSPEATELLVTPRSRQETTTAGWGNAIDTVMRLFGVKPECAPKIACELGSFLRLRDPGIAGWYIRLCYPLRVHLHA